jgi:hypothetical protein
MKMANQNIPQSDCALHDARATEWPFLLTVNQDILIVNTDYADGLQSSCGLAGSFLKHWDSIFKGGFGDSKKSSDSYREYETQNFVPFFYYIAFLINYSNIE